MTFRRHLVRIAGLMVLAISFFLLGSSAKALPPCPGGDYAKWHNCVGKHSYPNGGTYVGEWKDGQQNGEGTFSYTNGDTYAGVWKDGKQNGQGILTYAYGSKLESEWKNGILVSWLGKSAAGKLTVCRSGDLDENELKEIIFGYFNSPSPTGDQALSSMARDTAGHWNRFYFDAQKVDIKAIENYDGYTLIKAKVVLSLPSSESPIWAMEILGVRNAKTGGQVLAMGRFAFNQSELDDCWTTSGVTWLEGKAIN